MLLNLFVDMGETAREGEFVSSVTCTNVYKSCSKPISVEKLKILTPLQKLPKNVEDLGKLLLPKALKSCSKSYNSPNLVTLFVSLLQGG